MVEKELSGDSKELSELEQEQENLISKINEITINLIKENRNLNVEKEVYLDKIKELNKELHQKDITIIKLNDNNYWLIKASLFQRIFKLPKHLWRR